MRGRTFEEAGGASIEDQPGGEGGGGGEHDSGAQRSGDRELPRADQADFRGDRAEFDRNPA